MATRTIEARPDPRLGDIALEAAHAGGRAIIARLASGRTERSCAPDDRHERDPVTAADLVSDEAIRAAVGRWRPTDAWLTEESGISAGTTTLRWVVDPLDGTVNVIHGLDRFAVSVAVESERSATVVAAAVVLPALGRWLALSDGTVTAPGTRVGVTQRAAANALVSFAVPSADSARRAAYRCLTTIAPRVQDLRNLGSTVSDLADVATGRLDAFVSFNPKPWDVAAGVALVIAAGGTSRRWRRADGLDVLVAGGRPVVEALGGWLDD